MKNEDQYIPYLPEIFGHFKLLTILVLKFEKKSLILLPVDLSKIVLNEILIDAAFSGI